MKTTIQLTMAALLYSLVSTASAQWQTGVVSGAQYQENWSPIVLPWVSYENDKWRFDPTKIQVKVDLPMGALQTGVAIDYATVFDDTAAGLLWQTSTQQFLGPVRLAQSLDLQITEFQRWKSVHTLGSQFPLGSGFFGLEAGVQFASEEWVAKADATSDASTVLGAQYLWPMGDWRVAAMGNITTAITDDTPGQFSAMLMLVRQW